MIHNADVIIVGSGNAALCAAIAARSDGVDVLVIEKADEALAGGNSKYTAGAMRFVYDGHDDLLPLLLDTDDPRLPQTDFGTYSAEKFKADLLRFNDDRPLSAEQQALIEGSYDVVQWLASHGVKFEPIYARQSFEKGGKHVFWGGLTLAVRDEGVGLVEAELGAFRAMSGRLRFGCAAVDLITENDRVIGLVTEDAAGTSEKLFAKAVVLACGGFEANAALRKRYIGEAWDKAKVRGTPHNTGQGLEMAFELGAMRYGLYEGCHATPMDLHMKDYGNLDIPHLERKNYRKICYFLGVMVNASGVRFVDEGKDFRNYTYAQFGRAVLEQPGHFAWQIFDAKVDHLLYGEYSFHDAHFVEAETLDALIEKLEGVDDKQAVRANAGRLQCRRRRRCAVRSDGQGRQRDDRARSAEIQLGAGDRHAALQGLSGDRRDHLYLWRPEGGRHGRRAARGRIADRGSLRLRRACGRRFFQWLSGRIGPDVGCGFRTPRRMWGCSGRKELNPLDRERSILIFFYMVG